MSSVDKIIFVGSPGVGKMVVVFCALLLLISFACFLSIPGVNYAKIIEIFILFSSILYYFIFCWGVLAVDHAKGLRNLDTCHS